MTDKRITEMSCKELGDELIKLRFAVKKYHASVLTANSCTELLLADGCDPRPAEIMQDMYKAQRDMFARVDIDYFGGH